MVAVAELPLQWAPVRPLALALAEELAPESEPAWARVSARAQAEELVLPPPERARERLQEAEDATGLLPSAALVSALQSEAIPGQVPQLEQAAQWERAQEQRLKPALQPEPQQ